MKKLITYLRYLSEYLRHGDFISVVSAFKYVVNRTSHGYNRTIQTSVGTFFCRRNTNDFQFANYYYEWGVKKFILDRIRNYTVFIDVGSSIGGYTVLLSKYNLKCIAFEPLVDNYVVMLKNLQLNKLAGKVAAFQVGLGKENKQARFQFNPVNTGASFIDRNNDPSNLLCKIRTFDSMIADLKIGREEKILFKLDVEGMEAEALQGASAFIRQYPNITFIIEDKHTGKDPIKSILQKTADFDFGVVDKYNMYAHKIRNSN